MITMKKIILSVLLMTVAQGITAQEAADKKVQAGLVTGFGLNFQKMGTKLMSSNGAGNDLTIGANVNFSLTETVGFCTGLEFDFETLKYKPGSYNVYYYYNDTEILRKGDYGDFSNEQLYQLTSRTQKATYLTIPTMMLFRTNFLGYFRYFGKFGLRNSFLLSNKINDKGFNFDPESIIGSTPTGGDNTNMKAQGDMFFFKSAVVLVGGAEWNFTGSTSLVAELGYYYGFTPLHSNLKEDKRTLYNSGLNNGKGNDEYFNNKATQGQLMFKLSILF